MISFHNVHEIQMEHFRPDIRAVTDCKFFKKDSQDSQKEKTIKTFLK